MSKEGTQGKERENGRNISGEIPMGLKYSDNVLHNAPSHGPAIT